MRTRETITGVILAGGKSRRMRGDKALLTFEGEALISRIARTMKGVFSQVLLISNSGTYRFLGLPVFADLYRDSGPLAGIHSGLLHARTSAIFVVACDMPYVFQELIEYIVDFESNADVKIPMIDRTLHPLCGLYSRRCLPTVEESLRSGSRRVQEVLTRLHITVIPVNSQLPFYREDLLLNINEPRDYELLTQAHSFEIPS